MVDKNIDVDEKYMYIYMKKMIDEMYYTELVHMNVV